MEWDKTEFGWLQENVGGHFPCLFHGLDVKDFAKTMLSQAEPFFLIFQKSDAQNVISLLNGMDGCLANIISMMFILEVV